MLDASTCEFSAFSTIAAESGLQAHYARTHEVSMVCKGLDENDTSSAPTGSASHLFMGAKAQAVVPTRATVTIPPERCSNDGRPVPPLIVHGRHRSARANSGA
jgi:hypothetical protein